MAHYRSGRVAMAIAALMPLGCATGEVADVRAMAAGTFRCGRESVGVVQVNETPESTLYEAQGCGQRRRFVCEGAGEPVWGSGRYGHEKTVCRDLTK